VDQVCGGIWPQPRVGTELVPCVRGSAAQGDGAHWDDSLAGECMWITNRLGRPVVAHGGGEGALPGARGGAARAAPAPVQPLGPALPRLATARPWERRTLSLRPFPRCEPPLPPSFKMPAIFPESRRWHVLLYTLEQPISGWQGQTDAVPSLGFCAATRHACGAGQSKRRSGDSS